MEGKVTPKIRWLKLSLFLVASVTLALVVFNPPYAPVVSAQAPANESTLIALTNAERLKSGLQSLNFDPQLYQAAVTKAEDIFQSNILIIILPMEQLLGNLSYLLAMTMNMPVKT